MKASQCLFNSAVALRKVFISNAAALEGPAQLQRLLLPTLTVPPQTLLSSPSTRPFSTHPAAQMKYNRKTASSAPAAPTERGPMRDHGIIYPWVQLRRDDGTLTDPQRTALILKKLNLDRHTLILLASPRTDESSKGPEYPICRIADRKALQAAEAEKEAAKKKGPKIVSKEMELNWAIAPNDMRTRMTQLKKFLSKGYAVRVTLLNVKKRDKRRASMDEAQAALKAVRATVAEVPGAKETKPMEGTVGDTVVLCLHAPTGSAADKAAEEAGETAAAAAGGIVEKSAENVG
ncbi:hypothetical protein VTI74DRAFT_9886 [Chaetomium olivicolor]